MHSVCKEPFLGLLLDLFCFLFFWGEGNRVCRFQIGGRLFVVNILHHQVPYESMMIGCCLRVIIPQVDSKEIMHFGGCTLTLCNQLFCQVENVKNCYCMLNICFFALILCSSFSQSLLLICHCQKKILTRSNCVILSLVTNGAMQ